MNVATKNQEKTRKGQDERQQHDSGNERYILPRVNISEGGDGFTLEAEMPGVTREGLEILLEGNELTLVGRRQAPDEKGELIYRESSQHHYRRTFILDPTVDTAKIEARIENGVLKLHLPKAEQVKPKKIEIQG